MPNFAKKKIDKSDIIHNKFWNKSRNEKTS